VSRKWRNWYQNKVDEEIKGVDSKDKVKHDERMMTVTEQLVTEYMMQQDLRVTDTDEPV